MMTSAALDSPFASILMMVIPSLLVSLVIGVAVHSVYATR